MVRIAGFSSSFAIAMLLANSAGTADAANGVRRGALGVGQCSQIGEASLCIGNEYWAILKVGGRRVDFMAGGKVASTMAGQSVDFELSRDGNRYRVKVDDRSTATVTFAFYSEIRFRKRGHRFELTGYSSQAMGTDCELGVPYSGDLNFITGQQVAKVDGKVLWVGPTIPVRLRTPDLFHFKEEQLYQPYKLYNGLSEATGR